MKSSTLQLIRRFAGVLLILFMFSFAPLFAGFNSGTQNVGHPLTAGQKSKLKAAINKIKNNAKAGSEEEACAKALCNMLDPPDPDGPGPQQPPPSQFCAESGPASRSAYAMTLADERAGSAGDKINVAPDVIDGDCNILAGVMCHEWQHVGGVGAGAHDELKAWKAQKAWYDALGVDKNSVDYKWACCQIKIFEKSDDKKAKSKSENIVIHVTWPYAHTPQWGFRELILDNRSALFADESEGVVHGAFHSIQSTTSNDYTTSMDTVLDMEVMQAGVTGPHGMPVVAILGMDSSQAIGKIEFVEFSTATATVLQSLATLTLPYCNPLSAVCARVGGYLSIYVLDSLSGRILIIQDLDNDGIPETLNATVFADASVFSQLATALSIGIDPSNNTVVGATDADLRIQDVDDASTVYINYADTDNDLAADATTTTYGYDLAHQNPGAEPPVFGATEVVVFGNYNSTIELYKFSPSGTSTSLIGSAVIGTDLSAVISIGTPLVAGEMLMIQDVTTSPSPPSVVFRVQGWTQYGASCGVDPIVPRSDASGSTSGGATLTFEGYDLAPDSWAVLFVGFTPLGLSLSGYGAPGCYLYNTAELDYTVSTDGDGHGTLDIVVPSDSYLIGFDFYGQWFAPDSSANQLGLVSSNGTSFQIGYP